MKSSKDDMAGIAPGTGAIARARANRVDSAVDAMAAGRPAPPAPKMTGFHDEPGTLEKMLYQVAPSLSPRARKK